MKTKFYILGLFLMGGLLFTSSCKKEAEEIVASITKNIAVSIDGESWKTETVTTVKSNNKYFITALKGTEQLIFSLKDLAVGTYAIDLSNNTAVFTNGTDPVKNIFSAGSGEVKITAIIKDGKEFEGTFNLVTINASGDVKIFTGGTMTNVLIP